MNKLMELANGEKVARFVAQCCVCVSECREIKEREQIFQFSNPLLAPPEVCLLQLSLKYVITNSTCVKGASQICTAKKMFHILALMQLRCRYAVHIMHDPFSTCLLLPSFFSTFNLSFNTDSEIVPWRLSSVYYIYLPAANAAPRFSTVLVGETFHLFISSLPSIIHPVVSKVIRSPW